ncbi:tyrosine--tRNA ligase [Methylobacterium sp. BTF04]|uniref:tyrosine--tRNA ligase n=1 Tax=Methylobacterium sp. BTF04 TaxID=2708300 RepID=UPI0013D0B60C|nr:tyrosine--tRNA ligase [Methylobacterium sp. BTF04]NEU12192.1 tyrosine--tRNA ligase [Methylobacterium sp. BTF04]
MSALKSDFLRILQERGFIHQCSDLDGLDGLLSTNRITAYIGFDCTAASLHVGSLVQIMMLHWLQATGHRPIVLMGGGTTRIGDPTGRDEGRKVLSAADIESNKAGIAQVFAKFLTFGAADSADAFMVDNAEWLSGINYLDFLRDVGRHFSINRMMSFDSVRLRLEREQELSFLEFNYMLLQAYDYVELNRRYDVTLQMGGSDQWGNIVNGLDLGRRMGTKQLFALTTPLLTTSSGTKMGKTAAGAVWLNAEMLSPYDYWQFWRNTEDADVGRFLRLFTLLPMDEIARLEALPGAEINEAKKVLATQATALMHGHEAADAASETARKTFVEGMVAQDLPTVFVSADLLDAGLGVLSAFGPEYARLLPSTSEARRQIKGGGLRINDVVLTDERAVLRAGNLTAEGVIKLSFGRKKHVLLRIG